MSCADVDIAMYLALTRTKMKLFFFRLNIDTNKSGAYRRKKRNNQTKLNHIENCLTQKTCIFVSDEQINATKIVYIYFFCALDALNVLRNWTSIAFSYQQLYFILLNFVSDVLKFPYKHFHSNSFLTITLCMC